MHFTTISIVALSAISSVSAHGLMTSPKPRAVGDATSAACGSQVAAIIQSDPTSHVEGLPEAAAADPTFDASKCNLFLCKGLQFADNKANVVALTPGQSLELKFSIPIPHEGPCNVSVVNTKTNTLIGDPLISFASYADESLPVLPKNNTDMVVTVPTTLGSKCAVAGDCVIQWFWFGTAADQTYESCLDFTMADASGGGVDGGSSVSEVPSTTAGAAGGFSSVAATGASLTRGANGQSTASLGTTPLPAASVTAGSPTSKKSSSAAVASGTSVPSAVSSNGATTLISQLFGLGHLRTVAVWLVAADLALILMA